jgi:O-antigen ligase
MAIAIRPRKLAPARSYSGFGLAFLMGLAITIAMLALPIEVGIALAVVMAFAIFVLFDSWHAVLLLLVARSSLDALSDVAVAGGLNGAALLTAMVIVIGIEHIARRRLRIMDVPLAKPFVAILAISLVGIVLAPDPRLAVEHWMRLLSTFLLFVLILDNLRDDRQAGKLLAAVLLSVPLPVLVGLYQMVAGEGNHFTEGYNRILGTFVHPANFGVYLVTLLPVCAAVFMNARPSWSKLGLFIMAIAMVVCILFTFTRIVWIGLVIVALVIGTARTRATLVVIPFVLVLAFLFLPSVQDRLQGSTRTTGYGSGAWRLNLWGEELSRTSITSLPAGLGLGAVESFSGNPAHNEYLRIWLEMGVTGSIAYVWLYGSLIRRSLESYSGAPTPLSRHLILAFLALLAARLVIALTDNLLNSLALEWYFWALAALTLSIRQGSTAPEPSPPLRGAR